jgi:hypothetical protein
MTNAPARALSFRSWRSPSDSSLSEHPASAPPAAGEQKNDAQTVPLTAAEPHVDSVFVPRSVASICAEIEMTKRRRRLNECAGLEAVEYRPHYGKIKDPPPHEVQAIEMAWTFAGASVGSRAARR